MISLNYKATHLFHELLEAHIKLLLREQAVVLAVMDEDEESDLASDLANDIGYMQALAKSLKEVLNKASQPKDNSANPKFYVASSLGRRHAVSGLIKKLEEECGYTCTLNWTECVLSEDDDEDKRRSQLEAELEAVRQADFIVALPPIGRGSHGEIGAAAVLNKKIYYIGEVDKSCLLYEAFTYLYDVDSLIKTITIEFP